TSLVPTWLGAAIERSGDTAAAGIALQGGTKQSGGVGRIYLGNADEWDSTLVEGGSGKLNFYVRNGGAAMGAAAMTINASGDLKVQGNIEAKYQDVAEWVPSNRQLAPG